MRNSIIRLILTAAVLLTVSASTSRADGGGLPPLCKPGQRQDFSLQGRKGTQTASQRRRQEEENIKHGEEGRLQAAIIKFN